MLNYAFYAPLKKNHKAMRNNSHLIIYFKSPCVQAPLSSVGLSCFLYNLRLFGKWHSVKGSRTYNKTVQVEKTNFSVAAAL